MVNHWLIISGWWFQPDPSEKYEYEFVSWDDDIPNIWKDKKWSKPPTSFCLAKAFDKAL